MDIRAILYQIDLERNLERTCYGKKAEQKEELSANLLPEDDEPCHQADLTDDLEVSSPFDLVLCKDVLPFIPAPLMDKAICNLKKLTGKYLLLTWYNTPAEDDNAKYNAIPADEQTVVSLFGRFGFVYMPEYTASLRDISNCNTKNLIYVFKT